MSANSKIEWTDHTFNPWIGCTKVGPGCDNCYAAVSTPARTMRINWGAGATRHHTAHSTWAQPKQWNDQHEAFQAKHGRRQRVFCASLADVFDNAVPVQWRIELMKLITETRNLDWLLLTKRIGNAAPMLETAFRAVNQGREGWAENTLPNVWIGATIVNQEEADRDIPKLLAVPAAKRFLSMEPLLGPVDLRLPSGAHNAPDFPTDFKTWTEAARDVWFKNQARATYIAQCNCVDWVIVGGESGPGARPMHPDWARSLRDQCAAAGVPFLFKQWGEYVDTHGGRGEGLGFVHKGQPESYLLSTGKATSMWQAGSTAMHRVGKKAAGRLLDGITHDGFPA